MQTEHDPVDRALQSLAGQPWPGDSCDLQLESKLMQAYEAHKPAPALYRHRVLIPAVAIVLLAGTVFVAAGGIEMVRGWFVTTKINGQVVDTREIVPNPDGSASFTIPVPEIEGDTAVIDMSIDAAAGDGAGYKTINISLDGGETPGQAEVTITTQPKEESK